jgi:uncharacterized protein YuzE
LPSPDETAVVEPEEMRPGVILDFDKDERVVGVEILALPKIVKHIDRRVNL